ncbi:MULTISPECIES: PilT/PilU family type 4a pilus ATPase [unclassified Thioalkalivibrio]|uniref:PilT/PilU family type 4a pilus ATPase n=1 Tax=unclassified Thioalkalivibrio TaxID=2621013 RepID=UPI00036B761A|nr:MULTISPECIES: PilT/PilU family type 4a pilus ATPase [unclassified Thioalkalivibrio]
MSQMQIEPYLSLMAQKRASDLFFVTGAPASIKVDGILQPISRKALAPGQAEAIAREMMNEHQAEIFDRETAVNFGISRSGLGRFRVNVYRQRSEVAMVIRFIRMSIPTIEQLGLPAVLQEFVAHQDGLILIVGATGTGKSTTLASMIDHRNTHSSGHILTVEDPIEFLFTHKRSIVGQREVGIDTPSYDHALQEGMREAPDVIMIGEVRSRETMRAALTYADTGHLVLTTLHATNASQALDRVINLFPEDNRSQILSDLSLNLRAIIAQRLLQTKDGQRVAALEIMVNTPYIAELIRDEKISEIKEIMAKGSSVGMQTFDQAIVKLFKGGRVMLDEALNKADSRADLEWRLNFGGGVSAADEAEEDLQLPER